MNQFGRAVGLAYGFRYLYTTMGDEGLESNIEQSDFKAPMAGFG